jgi:carbon monoxide dehydrogenase subunit G
MATFQLRLHPLVPAEEAWRRILDLRSHSRLIPLTRVSGAELTADELRAGSQFVARTTIGPFAFDDPMVVDEISAPSSAAGIPGSARIRKVGRVIGGSIELRIEPHGDGSRVDWNQDIIVRGVPAAFGSVTAMVGRLAYGTMLRRLLAYDMEKFRADPA